MQLQIGLAGTQWTTTVHCTVAAAAAAAATQRSKGFKLTIDHRHHNMTISSSRIDMSNDVQGTKLCVCVCAADHQSYSTTATEIG